MLSIFKKFKFPYQVYNFFKKNELWHNVALYQKYGLNKKYYSSISSEDFNGIDSPRNKYDLVDSSKELPKNSNFQSLDEATREKLLGWSKDGYVILEKFFDANFIDAINDDIQQKLAKGQVQFKYRNKIMFAFHTSQLVRKAGEDEKLLKILSLLMDKPVDLFQSINFLTGSQQRSHSDSIHMTTFPYGNLIAVWVALEDITDDCGPLHYYPGSQTLPYVHNRDFGNQGTKYRLGDKDYSAYEDHIDKIIKQQRLEKKIFKPKKGDLLIWHANLLHGGEPVSNPGSSRKSMVFHYYAQDVICFHEVTQRPTLKIPSPS